MIIIHELDGYKYIGGHPANRSLTLRKNLTYIAFEITDWKKDKNMLKFLTVHMDESRVKTIYNILKDKVKDNKIETHYLVIRQDDDDERYYGKETLMITNVRPKEINKVLTLGKKLHS